ncbi:MAG TPA: fructose-bisphosphatase class II, partial [Candidatus Dormibacteraeota bacterium]
MEQQRSGIPSFEARGEVSLELVHATEAAALAAARLLGKGDPDRVIEVAGEAMRHALETSLVSGTVARSPLNEAFLARGTVIQGLGRAV